MTITIDVVGLDDFQRFVDRAPTIATRAARLAINQTAERSGIKRARDAMQAQVAFPAGYLQPPRFLVKRRATEGSLEAVIAGRENPTSLARFVTRRNRPRTTGLAVRIKPGSTVELPRAFILNLRGGNLGLAVRLRPGETLRNTIGAKLIRSGPLAGIALLYGPSVDQVFRTVAADIAPALADDLRTEFLRQFLRLSGER